MFFLQFISKFLKVLRAGESPPLVAAGFTMGFIVGLSPFLTLQNILILVIAFLTKVNLASLFFAMFVFGFFAFLLDPFFHNLGYYVLATLDALHPTWTTLFNVPLLPWSRFNNTVVMGSLLCGLALAVPMYFLSKKGIISYRETLAPKIENSKWIKAIKGSTLFKWYVKIRDLEW